MSEAFKDEIKTKIAKADALSIKRSFPMSLFKYYDPYLAAELYQEAGDICRTINDDLQASVLYKRSFDTYLMFEDASAKQSAAYVITKLAELFSTEKHYFPAKAINAFKQASLYHSLTGAYSIAASKTVSAAKLAVSMDDYAEGEVLYQEAIGFYDKAGMPLNRVLMLDELLICLVRNGNFRKAGDILVEMGSSRKNDGFLLVAWLSYYLSGEERPEVYELLGKDAEIVDLLNEGNTDKFEERIRGRLARITFKKIFFEIVDIFMDRGIMIDTR